MSVRTALRASLLSALLAAAVTAAPATDRHADAAPQPVPDPGRNSDKQTGWWWMHGASQANITSRVNQGYRLIDLEVEKTSPLRFSAAFVKNQGSYQRGWWWYYGLTASQVGNKLNQHGARLIDIESYSTGNGRRYAVVMVKNTGAAKKTWWWYYGQKLSGVVSKASANNARVVDVDRYATSKGSRYAVIMIRNTGVDQSGWWHYYNVTPNTIANELAQHKARLIGLERVGNNRYDVVMVKRTGHYWWWYHGLTAAKVAERAGQHAARITSIEPYTVNGKRRFAIILMSDTNAATAAVRAAMEKGLSSGDYGAYLKRVGGSSLVKLNVDHPFETASAIKVAHHLTAHQEWRDPAGAINDINVIVPWRADAGAPARYVGSAGYSNDKNVCAYDGNGNDSSSSVTRYRDQLGPIILSQMMMQSDNRTTDAVVNLLGFAAINDTMDALGMTKSELNHRIGCASKSSPQPWEHNRLTLRDAGRLYEAVADGSALGIGTVHQNSFYNLMLGGTPGANSTLGTIIAEEGAKAGLSAAEITQFRQQTTTRSKGGSYDLCPDSGACNKPYWWVRTAAGTLWVPFKNSVGRISQMAYVYGRFADEIVIDCKFPSAAPNCNSNKTAAPTKALNDGADLVFRTAVKKAMATW